MSLLCQICGNSENTLVHRAREMMFGLRDEFEYLECSRCGTLQIIEIPDLSRYYPNDYYALETNSQINLSREFKSRLAARFAAAYFIKRRNLVGKYLSEKKSWIKQYFPLSLSEDKLDLKFTSRILDFGSGSGRLLLLLHYFGFRNLTGVDAFIKNDIFYENGVKIYKRRLKELEPFFDFVMLHHSFEHLPNPLETLQEIHQLLKKDRFCLVRMPIINFAWEKYGVNWVQLDPPRHLFVYTEKSFRHLSDKAGFKIEKVIYDSESFQFWGSEQYLQDIPLTDKRSFRGDVAKSIFTAQQIADWEQQAKTLNSQNKGDQACFYLRKL